MILTYSKEKFKGDILAGIKIHSIRENKSKRWRKGMKINHWMHNPRNVLKNPHEFLINECINLESINIRSSELFKHGFSVEIEHYVLGEKEIETLCKNDGLSPKQFRLWFLKSTDWFRGDIIHWTDIKYAPPINPIK